MTKNIIRKNFLKILGAISIFFFMQASYASLSAQTVNTIKGHRPTLSEELENSIDDFSLFGLEIEGEYYYGDDLNNIPTLRTSYPFKNLINPLIKQPTDSQYFSEDGDEFDSLTPKTPLTLTWYYTKNNELIEFTPTDNDTFCSLSKDDKSGPYKIKISADLLLKSKYGDPNDKDYPNEIITTHPSKTYTLLEYASICYAQPELSPNQAVGASAKQWDKDYGFLVQSTSNYSKNFPTTGFYGAQFKLILSKDGAVNNYTWSIKEGGELVNIDASSNNNYVTIKFDTPSALDAQTAWKLVKGGTGHKVLIQGKHKTENYIIKYPFTITNWFIGWNASNNGKKLAAEASSSVVNKGCIAQAVNGNYRLSYPLEISNATIVSDSDEGDSNSSIFTREIGSLLGEWGNASQEAYPGSWAAAKGQANSFRRIWVFDPTLNNGNGKYCDLHTYEAIYHCEYVTTPKNGVCIAI